MEENCSYVSCEAMAHQAIYDYRVIEASLSWHIPKECQAGPVAISRQFGHGLLTPNLHGSYTLKNSPFYEIEYYPTTGQATLEFSQHCSDIGAVHLERCPFHWLCVQPKYNHTLFLWQS